MLGSSVCPASSHVSSIIHAFRKFDKHPSRTTQDLSIVAHPFSVHRQLPMGLPMDNLHSPTVASGPTSTASQNGTQKLSLVELIAQKDNVESELRALSSVLDSVRNFYRSSLLHG